MAIELSSHIEKQRALDNLIRNLSQLHSDQLPAEIEQKLTAFQEEIQQFVLVDSQQSKKLKGKILSKDDVLEMVMKHSGLNKWEIKTAQLSSDIASIKKNYSVTFDEVSAYILSFSTYDRHVIRRLDVICMPGHIHISADSGKVSFDTKSILTNKEAKDWIKSCFE